MKPYIHLLIFLSFSVTYAQEGLVKSYYPDDTLKSEINYERNVRTGDAKFFYENGKIKEEVIYINGRVDGPVKQYNEKGFLNELYSIEDGKRQGPTSYYDSAGTWIGDKDFDQGIRVIEKEPEKEITSVPVEVASNNDAVKKVNEEKNKIKKTEEATLPPSIKEDNLDVDPAYYLSAEVMPEPVGGMEQLQKKLIYPEYAKDNDIKGTVKIRAYIDQSGDVNRAEVVEGIGYGCDEVAKITVLYAKFSPGLIRGKPVKTQIIIPLEFKPAK